MRFCFVVLLPALCKKEMPCYNDYMQMLVDLSSYIELLVEIGVIQQY